MINVYESPDGGETVYERDTDSSSNEQHLVHQSEKAKKYIRWVEWRDILEAAENNPTLKNVIERAETIYALIKKENNEHY